MDKASRTPQQIGAALRRYRKARKLTQGKLGERINRRQATISALESGEGGTLGTLLDILAALELELVIRPRAQSNPADLANIF